MNELLKDIEFVFPGNFNQEDFARLKTEEPFSENAISFLDALASLLRKDHASNQFPELITLAFFCRRSNLLQLKKEYYSGEQMRTGVGIVFHIAPSNMAMNFAYSLVSGILSGNLNIVRLPSKRFTQIEIICEFIKTLNETPKFSSFAKRLLIVRYPKQSSATSYFSSICHARIIWGEDRTIEEIKKTGISPRAIDIGFGDKYSICVINADAFAKESSPNNIAQSFYNDTFLFDQNACTSPHLIVWLGSDENVLNAKDIFWNKLHGLVEEHYDLQERSVVDKLTAFYNQAIHINGIKRNPMPDNRIWRIELNRLTSRLDQHRSNCGYFVEYTASSLSDLSEMLANKYQTIASYGIEKKDWEQLSMQMKTVLHNRIKPIGKTSEFLLTWDGCNLIEALTKAL